MPGEQAPLVHHHKAGDLLSQDQISVRLRAGGRGERGQSVLG